MSSPSGSGGGAFFSLLAAAVACPLPRAATALAKGQLSASNGPQPGHLPLAMCWATSAAGIFIRHLLHLSKAATAALLPDDDRSGTFPPSRVGGAAGFRGAAFFFLGFLAPPTALSMALKSTGVLEADCTAAAVRGASVRVQ